MKRSAGLVVAVVLSAIGVGAVVALVLTRAPGESGGERGSSAASPLPTPVAGSGQLLTDAPSPTPILPTIPHTPATPAPYAGEGSPAVWIEGRYRVIFSIKADSCGQWVQPQEHDLVVTRGESSIRVEDTFTGSVLEGPAGADGSFRVESSTPLMPGSRRALRQIMTGRASPDGVAGDYFVYPAIRDCSVQLGFEGRKVS